MGTDITVVLEAKTNGVWQIIEAEFPDWCGPTTVPFNWRSYGLFGFLADVQNYSHVPPICAQRGTPSDLSVEAKQDNEDTYFCTWLTVADFNAVDYDKIFWNRRITRGNDGAALANEGEGEHVTLREFLGTQFFEHLTILRSLGKPEDVRVVLAFD